MLRVLYTLPRTIVLLLQPQDFPQYVTVPDRGFICDVILTNRWREGGERDYFSFNIPPVVPAFLMATLEPTQ